MHDCRNIPLVSVYSETDSYNIVNQVGFESVFTLSPAEFPLTHVIDDSCTVESLQVRHNTFEMSTIYDPNLFTLVVDGSGVPTLTATASRNDEVKQYDSDGTLECDLVDVNTSECIIFFKVEVLTKNGTVTTDLIDENVRFGSECYLLSEPSWSTKQGYWNVVADQVALFNDIYFVRDSRTIELPWVEPYLPSIDSEFPLNPEGVYDLCGQIQYSLVNTDSLSGTSTSGMLASSSSEHGAFQLIVTDSSVVDSPNYEKIYEFTLSA